MTLPLRLLAAAAALALGAGAPARGENAAAPAPAAAQSEVERFCLNIADSARDRRYALQAEELARLQAEIDGRIAALEEKRAEVERWLKKREDFAAQAEGGVVQIYRSMRPDAAAERLAELKLDLAAAILMKLDARKAGVILNEMDKERAASLTGVMAAAARKENPS